MKMESVSLILVLILAESFGLPQIPPSPGQNTLASPDQFTPLVSPWSQWMSLKAPPIGLVKPKKKLLPGPIPSESSPEAPWLTWTRMKVSSALSPPLPPSPAGAEGSVPSANSISSATNTSATEKAVWIQWTQMKIPLSSPTASANSTQETPWDAWTKLKSPIAQAQIPTGGGPSISK